MYTGYFGNMDEYRDAGLIPVSVCIFPPLGYNGARYPEVAPPVDLFRRYRNGQVGIAQFTMEYREFLVGIDVAVVAHDLSQFGCIENMVLLCHEPAGSFCHRTLLAEWLTARGIPCREYARNHADCGLIDLI